MNSDTETKIFHFQDPLLSNISQVGGKGYSLIKMSQAKLAIPPGFVLAVSFFKPWISQLKQLEAWKTILNSPKDVLPENLNKIKAECSHLTLTEDQSIQLKEALRRYPDMQMFAVRSSSPEEDLAGASFAGGYETILGVTHQTMVEAIKKAFASCLDYRVFVYKKEKGFAVDDFSIAIVVMKQIASEISGVGFSLNPLNNDYDEAVFNANWGLGETVVAGLCNPDQYIMNKVEKKLIECKIGKKETQIWLNNEGGTFEKEDPRHDEQTLKENHLKELVEQILIIEKYYGQPMDIEWAIEKNILYILQARPITTHLELPEIMKTKPGEPRNLYLDATLTIQGLDKPFSVLGACCIEKVLKDIGKRVFASEEIIDIKKGVSGVIGGKGFANLTNIWTIFDRKSMAPKFKRMNTVSGLILEEMDDKIYSQRPIPNSLNFTKAGMFWRLPAIKLKFPYFFMKRIESNLTNALKDFDEIFATIRLKYHNKQITFKDGTYILTDQFSKTFSQSILPAFIAGISAQKAIEEELFVKYYKENPDLILFVNDLAKSLPNNITNQMGLDLFRLTLHLDKLQYDKVEKFKEDFHLKKLKKEFYYEWNSFMYKYGFRGSREIDVKEARYQENPELILNQIHSLLINSQENNNPIKTFEQAEIKRKIAHDKLCEIARKEGFARKFEKSYQLMYHFAGYRETHKYYVIKLLSFVRGVVLNFAEKLVKENLLKDSEHIFDLTLQNLFDLEDGSLRPTFNELEMIRNENTKLNNLYLKWPFSPVIIDSRGRILTLPKKPLNPGELEGQSVSFGKVKGFVKVLKTADEKPFLAGEILVTKATDPGWTPLIINSGGIILEVGGMLQHGALVSREFGKPCIVGVDDATKILHDGDEVEIDGTCGVVRILSQKNGNQIEK